MFVAQKTTTCSNLSIETLEKGVKMCSKMPRKH